MRFKSTTFEDLLNYYSFIVRSDFWAVAQTRDLAEYDIYYIDDSRYEYLASDTVDTSNQVTRMILEKVGLC